MRLVYTAGPISAKSPYHQTQHIRRAERCAQMLMKVGLAVICPQTMTRFWDGLMGWKEFLRADFEIIKRCDAVVMLPGWNNSKGATQEHTLAKEEGLAIFYWSEEEGFMDTMREYANVE